MQDWIGCDNIRTPVIFQGFDNCNIVGDNTTDSFILTPSMSLSNFFNALFFEIIFHF